MPFGELLIYPNMDEIDLPEDGEEERREKESFKPSALFVQAPYGGDAIQFRGEPTSLLYAVSVFANRVHEGEVPGMSDDNLDLMNPPVYDEKFKEDFKAYMYEHKPKTVGISCTTSSSVPAKEIAAMAKEIAKELGYEVITVLGGAHERDMASMLSDGTSAEQKSGEGENPVDFSATGESEETFDSLLSMIFEKEPSEIQALSAHDIKQLLAGDEFRKKFAELKGKDGGFAFVLDGENRRVGTSGEKIDLDKLPPLPRQLLRDKSANYYGIFRKDGHDVKTAQVMTCRGCKGGCAFCSEHRRFNPASAEKVIAEVEDALAQEYKAIFFDDSTFTWFHENRTEEEIDKIFEVLKAKGVEWGCQTRADKLDEHIIEKMKESGCTYIYLGVESADPQMLEAMHKGETIDEIEKTIDLIDKAGIRVGMSLVFGTEGKAKDGQAVAENQDSVNQTLGFVKRKLDQGTNISLVSMNLLTYYPDSPATKMLSREQKMRLAAESSPDRTDLAELPDEELLKLTFTNPIIRNGYPWNRFEDGQGHHPECITDELARYIIERGVEEIGEVLQGQDLYMVPEIYEGIRSGKNKDFVDLNHASLTTPRLTSRQIRFRDDLLYSAPKLRYHDLDEPKDALWWEEVEIDTYEKARSYAADIFGLPHDNDRRLRHVVLAPNTTEAENTALMIALLTDKRLSPDKHFKAVSTDAENFSVLRILKRFEDYSNPDGRDNWSSYQDFGVGEKEAKAGASPKKLDSEVKVVDVLDSDKPEDEIISAVDSDTSIVIFSHVMRDNGRIVDAKKVCEKIREINPDCWIIVDGAQAFGALPPFDVREIGCDFYVGTPHKTLNSYPVGIMYMADRPTSNLPEYLDQMYGSEFEHPYRSGMFAGFFGKKEDGARYDDKEEEFDHERFEYLSPREVRSFSAQFEPDVLGETLTPEEEAQQHEGIRIGKFFGMQTIPERVIRKITNLETYRKGLRESAVTKLEAEFGESITIENSGSHSNFILSFRFNHLDNRQLVDHLWRQEKPITLSYIARSNNIRISFNQYDTADDLGFFIESLKAAVQVEREKQA